MAGRRRRRPQLGLDVRFWSAHSWSWDDRLADVDITDRIVDLTGWLHDAVVDGGDVERAAPPRFVDIGCGTGNHARSLAGRGAEVVGVDFAPGMLAKAAAKATPTTVFVQADLRDGLPLRADAFDGALSVYSAQFFDLVTFASVARHVLRPGGALVLELPRPDAGRRVRRDLSWRHQVFQRVNATAAFVGVRVGLVHVRPPEDVDAALEQAGFTVVEHRDRERSLAVLARAAAISA
jgi:SAM-dependent methyltransferase